MAKRIRKRNLRKRKASPKSRKRMNTRAAKTTRKSPKSNNQKKAVLRSQELNSLLQSQQVAQCQR